MRFILATVLLLATTSAFAQYSREERSRYDRSSSSRGAYLGRARQVHIPSLVDEAAGILRLAIANDRRDRRFRPMLDGLLRAEVRAAPREEQAYFDEACPYSYSRASIDPRNPRIIDLCPAFFEDQRDYQLTVLLHEAFHAGRNPGSRRGETERDASRAAQDARVAAGLEAGLDS